MSQDTLSDDAYRTRTLPETTPESTRVAAAGRPGRKQPGGSALPWLLVLLSLALNGIALIWLYTMHQELKTAQGQLQDVVRSVRAELTLMRTQPLELLIGIDQEIPISDTVTISDTFAVPVKAVLPFSTQVNTSFLIPLLGRQEISLPVSGSVPVEATFEIPVQADFPISMTTRLVLDMPVSVTLPAEFLQPIDDMLQQVEDRLR